MSEQCHVCGSVKHEAPTVICAPCRALIDQIRVETQPDGSILIAMPDPRLTEEEISEIRLSVRQFIREEIEKMRAAIQ